MRPCTCECRRAHTYAHPHARAGKELRRLALTLDIPTVTTINGAWCNKEALRHMRTDKLAMVAIQDYFRECSARPSAPAPVHERAQTCNACARVLARRLPAGRLAGLAAEVLCESLLPKMLLWCQLAEQCCGADVLCEDVPLHAVHSLNAEALCGWCSKLCCSCVTSVSVVGSVGVSKERKVRVVCQSST